MDARTKEEPGQSPKTESEKLFEQYLRGIGVRGFEYHPQLPGSKKRPDYGFTIGGRRLLCEVSEVCPPQAIDFAPKQAASRNSQRLRKITGGFVKSPEDAVRRKIQAEWSQLRDFPADCCCIVLHAPDPYRLAAMFVEGAMFGKVINWTPFDPVAGLRAEHARLVFSPEGGEMIWDTGEPRKTNISAVVVLDQLPVGEMIFRASRARATGNSSALSRAIETYEEARRARGTKRDVSLRELRVVVYENPYAKKRLPSDIFCGPYDERYGFRRNWLERIFVGRELRKLETKGGTAKSPLSEILRRSQRRGKLRSKSR